MKYFFIAWRVFFGHTRFGFTRRDSLRNRNPKISKNYEDGENSSLHLGYFANVLLILHKRIGLKLLNLE